MSQAGMAQPVSGAAAERERPGAEDFHLPLATGWRLRRVAALRSAGLPLGWLEPFACAADATGEQVAEVNRAAIAGLVRRESFLEAITWQNPELVANWLGAYAAAAHQADPHLPRRAQREVKLARYAQRYCAKNDTVGFFGPVAWAEFGGDSLEISGGLGIVSRSVHVETWVLARLVAHWAEDSEVRPHLPVRLHPAASYDGTAVRLPNRPPLPVDPAGREVLDAIAGHREGRVVAQSATVEALRRAGVVRVGFPVPIDDRPERGLAVRVEAVTAPAARTRMRADLVALEQARAAAEAAREPGTLLAALAESGRVVARLTGGQGGRAGVAGRTPLYLDSRRDLQVQVGAEALDRLAPALALVLDSARWFVGQLAEDLRGQLRARFHALRARTAGRPVTLSDLLFASADLLSGAPGTVVDDVVADLTARWAELLPAGQNRTRLDSTRLAPLAGALFPPGPPAWATARYHSPDLMLGWLDGRDRPAVWVLGELHVAFNGLENRVFRTQCTAPERLDAAAGIDLAGGRILPLYPVTAPETGSRTYPPSAVHVPDLFAYWSYADDDGHPTGAPSLPGTGIFVEERNGELLGFPSGRSWCAPVLEFFGDFATALAVNRFCIRPPAPHGPRIRVDDLVVAREEWQLPVASLADLCAPRDRSFAALRQRLAALGMPRHLFYRAPAEPKPCYLDLAAPLLLRGFADTVRRAARGGDEYVDLSEMLPGPGQLWLAGPDGPLTSEFRVVALDARPHAPVLRPAPCRR